MKIHLRRPAGRSGRLSFAFAAAAVLMFAVTPAFADDYQELYAPPGVFGPPRPHLFSAISSNAQKTSLTLQGIFFTSDYDNGSIGGITAGGTNIFNCTLFVEDSNEGLGTSQYQFRFKMTGVAGRTITLNLSHTQNPRPFVSFDGVTFRRMTSAEAPNTLQMVLTCGATQNFAEVAFYDPLGVSEILARVNQLMAAGSGATSQTIGNSYQGRPMWMITVTDPAFPDSGKHRIWVHSRAHSGEITASWCMLGLLQQVTENSDVGRRLRRFCIFNIVPIENVDGVYLGLTRWSAQGLDLERQWGVASPPAEVANLKAQVNTLMASSNPIQVALNLHSTVSNYSDNFFWKHLSPSVTVNFETIQQRYIDALNNATPLFNNAAPQTSQLNASIFIESYFWNNWGESVMAMTHEGHFFYVTGTSTYNTGQTYYDVGRALAVAMIEYFTLPVPVTMSAFELN
jgi:hypothetical protein